MPSMKHSRLEGLQAYVGCLLPNEGAQKPGPSPSRLHASAS